MKLIRPPQVRGGSSSAEMVLVGKYLRLPRAFHLAAPFLRQLPNRHGTIGHAILTAMTPARHPIADPPHPNDPRTLEERLQTMGRIRYR